MNGPEERLRPGQLSWVLYEWARNPYFTIVLIFIFAPYFTTRVIGDPVRGQALWGYTQSLLGLAVALGSPFLGAAADAGGSRKPWIAGFTYLALPFVAALWLAEPGAASTAVYIAGAVVVATVCLEYAAVFHNSMLPALAPVSRIGTLSGLGTGIGSLGGLLLLILVLLAFVLPEQPMFGLDRDLGEPDRIVGPAVALWVALFTVPFLVITEDVPASGLSLGECVRRGARNLAELLRSVRHYRNVVRFLVARMIYNDGMIAVQSFGGIYAAGTFGWELTELGLFGIVIILSAAIGALLGGRLDDRIGSKRMIMLSLIGMSLLVLGFVSTTSTQILFGLVSYPEPAANTGGAIFATVPERFLISLGALIGLLFGPAFASSRTMLARLAPESMVAEFYGLYALSGMLTAFAAPLLIGLATDVFESQRAGFAVIGLFLVAGFFLMWPLQETRTRAHDSNGA